jgi:hypothetical protein
MGNVGVKAPFDFVLMGERPQPVERRLIAIGRTGVLRKCDNRVQNNNKE